MNSGFSKYPPQPTVHNAEPVVCSFIKNNNTATGAVGLLTYDLFHKTTMVCNQRLAIMFSVPYDRNLYSNQLAVGLFNQSRACDNTLYEEMYDGKTQESFKRSDGNGSCLTHRDGHVSLRATMSSIGRAIVKVELLDQM